MAPELTIFVWGVAFLASHLALSHPPLRTPLVDKLGVWGFRGVYSVVSTVAFVGLVLAWWPNRHAGDLLWNLRVGPVGHIVELFIVLAFALIGAGAIKATPNSLMFRGAVPGEVNGPAAITRHPVGLGVALFALCHMAMNGWVGDLAFWGTLFAVGVLGTMHQDSRYAAEDPAYKAFMEKTSYLPMPTPSALRRLGSGWIGAIVGIVVAVVIRIGHGHMFS